MREVDARLPGSPATKDGRCRMHTAGRRGGSRPTDDIMPTAIERRRQTRQLLRTLRALIAMVNEVGQSTV